MAAGVIRFKSAAGLQKSEIATSGTPAFQGQMISFFKNFAIWSGLLFVATVDKQGC
ncbi:MAG: hypothetical protein ACLPZY_03745 [Terracidiphilus sp.]